MCLQPSISIVRERTDDGTCQEGAHGSLRRIGTRVELTAPPRANGDRPPNTGFSKWSGPRREIRAHDNRMHAARDRQPDPWREEILTMEPLTPDRKDTRDVMNLRGQTAGHVDAD